VERFRRSYDSHRGNVKNAKEKKRFSNKTERRPSRRVQVLQDVHCRVLMIQVFHNTFDVTMKPLCLHAITCKILSFRIASDYHNQNRTYNDIYKESESFRNPGVVENSFVESGLHPQSHNSFMSSSRSKFPQDEYAKDLRQLQASKLAFR
jgi:hypothetical protein